MLSQSNAPLGTARLEILPLAYSRHASESRAEAWPVDACVRNSDKRGLRVRAAAKPSADPGLVDDADAA